MHTPHADILVFTGNANPALAAEIVQHLGTRLGAADVGRYSDGEVAVEIRQNVRMRDVFVVQSTCAPTNDHLMELLVMVDALKRAAAERICAVIPYFGYARQDRRPRSSRVPITAKVVANMLQAVGVAQVLTMDLHADQIQGFFDIPVDHLDGSVIFVPYIKSLDLPNLTIASPDMGGSYRSRTFAKFFNAEVIICDKRRKRANEIESMSIIGDVTGQDVVLIDDICDTAGTLSKAAALIMENGAKSVRAVCTHAVLSGNAYDTIENSVLTEIILTDTIRLDPEKSRKCGKIKVLSTAGLFAEAIRNVNEHGSISDLFRVKE